MCYPKCRSSAQDAASSMRPMRGDVKEKYSPVLSERRMDVAIGIQPDLRSGEALCSRRASYGARQATVSARRFNNLMVRRLRSGSYTSKPGLALIRQPWSCLRLVAYSFFGYARGHRVHLETRCRQHAEWSSSSIDTLPRPGASQEPIGSPSGKSTWSIAWVQ